MTRTVSLVAAVVLATSAPLAAQDTQAVDWLDIAHHGDRAPDYLADLVRGTADPISLPPPPIGEPPAVVRGLYLNAWVFGSSRFYDLVRLADSTEINAFVIDVKDDTGFLTFASSVPTAIAIGANQFSRARDVRARLALLESRGIHPIARIVVAKDPLLARHKPDWAIHHRAGGLWQDRQRTAWVDAYNDSVWTYAADIAGEAVLMGFSEIQFDYVRFPDEPREMMANAVFPGRRSGESQRGAIRRQLTLLRDRVRALGVPFTIDVFGLTTSSEGDVGIGQRWEDLVELADVVLPMVYPSHYHRGSFGYARPNAEPYNIVRRALEDGIRRTSAAGGRARIRPYLQAFTLGRPRYTPYEVREQIRATEDLGLSDWVLWNARGVYPAGALKPEVHPTSLGLTEAAESDGTP